MKPSILVQLDTDPRPSVFDAVVATDAGVDRLLAHGGVTPENVVPLVHGAIFTRGPADLKRTALFVGGSDVSRAEAVGRAIADTFFGPFRVSVLLDPNGSNTTAAAAVLAARDGLGGSLGGARVAVLGGTGPVGLRVARLCIREGATAAIGSRDAARAADASALVADATGTAVPSFGARDATALADALEEFDVVIAAGAAGVALLPLAVRSALPNLRVVIDLNAVPPAGIEGVDPTDRARDRQGARAWGALGVGGTKMKIHKKAIQALFEANDRTIDAEQCLALGKDLAPAT
jgi:hypothetical protein